MGDTVIGPIDLGVEPVRRGGEHDTLFTFLEYFRSVLIRKAVGLTAEQLAAAIAPSTLTVGGLVKHMAFVEDHWFQHVLLGNEYPEPWCSADWDTSPDWEFDTAPDDPPATLLAQFDASISRSRVATASVTDLDTVAVRPSHGQPTTLRWILVHMIEEYARHCGHADLIRESIDGAVGD